MENVDFLEEVVLVNFSGDVLVYYESVGSWQFSLFDVQNGVENVHYFGRHLGLESELDVVLLGLVFDDENEVVW